MSLTLNRKTLFLISKRFIQVFALFFSIILSSSLYSQSMINSNLSLPEILHESDAIIYGQVTSKQAEWVSDAMIATYYEIHIIDTIYNSKKSTFLENEKLVLRFAGGVVDGYRVGLGDHPEFEVSDEVIFFLDQKNRNATSPLVGSYQGFLKVDTDNETKRLFNYRGQQVEGIYNYQKKGLSFHDFIDEMKKNLPLIQNNRQYDWRQRKYRKNSSQQIEKSNTIENDKVERTRSQYESGQIKYEVEVHDLPPLSQSKYAQLASPPDMDFILWHADLHIGAEWEAAIEEAFAAWNIYLDGGWNGDFHVLDLVPGFQFNPGGGLFEIALLSTEEFEAVFNETPPDGWAGFCAYYAPDFLGDGQIVEANLILNSDLYWTNDFSTAYDIQGAFYMNSTLVHELGHAVGMAHPWSSGGTFDPWANTVMTYYNIEQLYTLSHAPYMMDARYIRDSYPDKAKEISDFGVFFHYSSMLDDTTHPNHGTHWTSFDHFATQGEEYFIEGMVVENLGTHSESRSIDFYLSTEQLPINYNDDSMFHLGTIDGSDFGAIAPNHYAHFTNIELMIPHNISEDHYYLVADIGEDDNSIHRNKYAFSPIAIFVLEGEVTDPELQLTPSAHNFGAVQVGEESEPEPFTLKNAGGGVAEGIVFTNTSEYVVTEGEGSFSLGAGEEKDIEVVFTPSSEGSKPDWLEAETDDQVVYAELTGTGETSDEEDPEIVWIPDEDIDFGEVEVGSTSDEVERTLKNIGGGTASGDVFLNNDEESFTITQGGGSFNLDAGDELTVKVQFQPEAEGSFSDWLDAELENGDEVYLWIQGTGIETPEAPVAGFTVDETSGVAPLTVQFTDQSSNNPTSWSWNFGDGNTSAQQNPQHTYQEAGSYTVSLEVSNDGGSDTETKVNHIEVDAPALTVDPTALTIGSASGASGSFDIASNISWSISSPPSWLSLSQSSGSGNAEITITATSANDSSESRNTVLTISGEGLSVDVQVTQEGLDVTPPVADFSANPQSGMPPLEVQFTDQSTHNPTSWSWDFGDGNTSTQQNPQHTYQDAGSFTVSLEVSNEGGNDTETKVDYIVVDAPELTVDPTSLTLNAESGSSDNFEISSNISWNITGDPDWLALSSSYGSGNQEVTVTTTSTNSSENPRYATLQIDGGGQSAELMVTQQGSDPVFCIASDEFPFGSGTAPEDNQEELITQSIWAGEYIIINSIVQNETYRFRSSTETDYLTLTDDSDNVIKEGATPISWTASFPGAIRLHVHTDSSCGTEELDRSIFVKCMSCSEEDPELQLTPSAHNFGTVPVGQTSAYESFTLKNTGGGIAEGDAFTYTSEFVILEGGGSFSLGAGEEKNIKVVFSPSSEGSKSDWLDAETDDQVVYAELTGTGEPSDEEDPEIVWIPDEDIDFGEVESGSSSGEVTRTLKNVGGGTAFGEVLIYGGEESFFTITEGGGSFNLDADDELTVKVQFQPETEGSFSDWLDAELDNGDYVYLRVEGTGIETSGAPGAGFTVDETSGVAPLTVQFTDQSSNNPTSWSWNFGDGNTSTQQNPQHTFQDAGSYTVSLEVSNEDGNDTETKVNYIEVYTPALTVDPTALTIGSASGASGSMDISSNISWSISSPPSWLSLSQSSGSGNAEITITATSANDSSESRSTILTISAEELSVDVQVTQEGLDVTPPVADFSASPQSGMPPLEVQFTDQSTGNPTSWSWDFGDGNTSTQQNPQHTYQEQGSYTITLEASNVAGDHSKTKHNYITVYDDPGCPPPASLQAEVVSDNDVLISWEAPQHTTKSIAPPATGKTYNFQDQPEIDLWRTSLSYEDKKDLKALSFTAVREKQTYFNLQPSEGKGQVVLYYDNGEIGGQIGLSQPGELYAAVRFPESMLSGFNGYTLDEVAVSIREVPDNSKIMIWGSGTSSSPGSLLYQQEFFPTEGSLNYIELNNPLILDGSDIWVGYRVDFSTERYPCGGDTGPAVVNGDWVSLNGVDWARLSQLSSPIDRNWVIRALISPDGADQHPVAYNIYRNGQLLESVAHPKLEYTDESLDPGVYTYSVTAQYEDCESEAVGPVEVTIGQETYTLNLLTNPEDGGSVVGEGVYPEGETIEIIATPSDSYDFSHWSGNHLSNLDDAYAPTTYFTMPASDAALTANFSQKDYLISTGSEPESGGNTSGGGTYNHGQTVSLQADPNEGYTFSKWTENGLEVSDNANYTFIAESDRDLTAHFDINTYEISAQPNNEDLGSVSGEGTYEHFQEVTLTAVPKTDYHFVEWTEGGEVVMDGNEPAAETYTFMAEEDRSLIAHFAINTFEISAQPNDEDFGSVSGAGTYVYLEDVTLTAAPETGYHFVEWQENGEMVMDGDEPAGATYTFIAEEDRDLIAHFAINTYEIIATAGEGGSIDPDGDIVVGHGDNMLFNITPDEGHGIFVVLVDNESVGAVEEYEFVAVTGNHTITAVFSEETGLETLAEQVNVYPNPFNNTLTITNASGLRNITLKNLFGQPVFEKETAGTDEEVINTESLPPGVYVLRLTGTDDSVRLLKMIKE